MSKNIKLFILLIFLSILLCTFISCSENNDNYYATWIDADGTLIEYSTVPSNYDPSTRALPSDNENWHYTGWNVVLSGNQIECTAIRVKKVKIQWIDADGTILKEESLIYSDNTNFSFPLPEDTNEWHYTEWLKSESESTITFSAKRIGKEKYVWKDADGSVLKEEYVLVGEEKPFFNLPPENPKWKYLNWNITETSSEHIYTAVRAPNESYFAGNVFQIVVKDAMGTPTSTGSGFVLNDDGWFITNNHVMDGASSAVAFFDIVDTDSGNKYTQLNIIGGVYNSYEKDIFIGKIEGYEKIKHCYNDIKFTENYTVGEVSYTIGYPNSSVKLEINSGVILEEYSDIYDKINGVFYVLSDSYIAPGSSGGILINQNFEIIGITTIGFYADSNKQMYTAGGSVPTFVFLSQIQNLDETKIKNLTNIYIQGE